MSGTRKVYETVVYDPSRGTGAAGDYTHIIRSTSRAVVERAAKGMTYYGAPATVREDVPLRACFAAGKLRVRYDPPLPLRCNFG